MTKISYNRHMTERQGVDILNEIDPTKTNIVTKTEGRAVRGMFGN